MVDLPTAPLGGPKNFVLSVSGDFDKAAMVKKLEKAFARLAHSGREPRTAGRPDQPAEQRAGSSPTRT